MKASTIVLSLIALGLSAQVFAADQTTPPTRVECFAQAGEAKANILIDLQNPTDLSRSGVLEGIRYGIYRSGGTKGGELLILDLFEVASGNENTAYTILKDSQGNVTPVIISTSLKNVNKKAAITCLTL